MHFRKYAENVVQHAAALAVTILAMWGIQYLLKFTVSEDAKLFDVVPVDYVWLLGDLAAMLRCCWKVATEA